MRERDPEKSRQSILEAAEEEFAQKGFWGARVDEIAARAQINKRMIYAYFGDKEGLYQQVLFWVYARMEEAERQLMGRKLSGKALIREIISVYFDFLQQNPTFVSILMWENLNQGRYLKAMESSRIRRDTLAAIERELEEGKATGVFRKSLDSRQTALSLITVCFANFSNQHSLSRLLDIDLTHPSSIQERKEHTVQLMLAALCHDTEGGKRHATHPMD